MRKVIRMLQNERGAETLEWILIAGLIVVLSSAVYGSSSSPLRAGLKSAVTSIGAKINTAVK